MHVCVHVCINERATLKGFNGSYVPVYTQNQRSIYKQEHTYSKELSKDILCISHNQEQNPTATGKGLSYSMIWTSKHSIYSNINYTGWWTSWTAVL